MTDRIEALEAKLAVAREALKEVAVHCANTGYGNPIVNERIVDRCEETAKLALREIDADRKAAMDELIAKSAEELDND